MYIFLSVQPPSFDYDLIIDSDQDNIISTQILSFMLCRPTFLVLFV